MTLDLAAARRYGKQIALPDFGPIGQERVLAAEVALVGSDLAIETCALYLAGAGVQRFRRIGAEGWPGDGAAWEAALEGVALVVRSGFDDDPMLRAAVRRGVPVVVMRAAGDLVDLLALRRHGPCPHQELDLPARPAAEAPEDGAGAVLAGTLAASEALLLLARPGEPPRARHLRLPLGGDEPTVVEIPWAPECFLCGGSGREVTLG
jgi:hypothetical protein